MKEQECHFANENATAGPKEAGPLGVSAGAHEGQRWKAIQAHQYRKGTSSAAVAIGQRGTPARLRL